MAGSYPDAPGPKIAYDIDGSAGVVNRVGSFLAATAGELAVLNNESTDSVLGGTGTGSTMQVFIIFAQPMDIVGLHWAWLAGAGQAVPAYSMDTSNGLDGTWTTFTALGISGMIQTDFRTGIVSLALPSGVKSLRLHITGSSGVQARFYSFHVYGTITSPNNPNRLRLWHPTLDQALPTAWLDFGNVSRSGPVAEKSFRVKNNAEALTANTVNASTTALTDASPTVLSQLTLNYNGGAFGASATGPATLVAGAISDLFTLRLTPSATAAFFPWRQRLLATAASFT